MLFTEIKGDSLIKTLCYIYIDPENVIVIYYSYFLVQEFHGLTFLHDLVI